MFSNVRIQKDPNGRCPAHEEREGEDTIIEFGAPTKTVTDNDCVMTGKAWCTVNRK